MTSYAHGVIYKLHALGHWVWGRKDDTCSFGGHGSLPHDAYTAMHSYRLCQLDKHISDQLALKHLSNAETPFYCPHYCTLSEFRFPV